MPPSAVAAPPSGSVPPQSMPSVSPQLAAPPGTGPQVPSVAPAVLLHTPLQHSVPAAHTSPICSQNEEAWHFPPWQRREQHSAPEVQSLLRVLQVVLSGAHIPAVHWPLQQLAFPLQ